MPLLQITSRLEIWFLHPPRVLYGFPILWELTKYFTNLHGRSNKYCKIQSLIKREWSYRLKHLFPLRFH